MRGQSLSKHLVVIAALTGAMVWFALTAPAHAAKEPGREADRMNRTIAEKLFHQPPAAIRQDLQEARTPDLNRRRQIIGLALIGMAAMIMVTLFQTGVIQHMPDLPGRFFDSAKVNSSDQAYKFGVPDGTIVVVSLGLTILLAAFGGMNRAEVQPWIPVVLTGKAGVDAVFSAMYLWNMATVQKVACIYCIITALATFLIVALSLPEAVHAARR